MKLKSLVFVLFLFVSVAGIAQTKGDVRIGAYGHVASFGSKMIPQYGLNGELFITDNLSLVYKYAIGKNVNGDLTGHINPALFLLAVTASYPAAALGTLLISEGISYHIAINESIEVAPYISPLGAELNLYPEYPIVLSCAVGVNLFIKNATPFENISFAPYGGAVIIYRDGNVMPVVGFSVNYTFTKNYD
jgi:hypothetical protein